jgi:hypothetical protein
MRNDAPPEHDSGHHFELSAIEVIEDEPLCSGRRRHGVEADKRFAGSVRRGVLQTPEPEPPGSPARSGPSPKREPSRPAGRSHAPSLTSTRLPTTPRSLRFVVVKRPMLLKRLERRLVRAVWRWQRQVARALGVTEPLRGGAVVFTHWFGSTLQLIDQSRYPT